MAAPPPPPPPRGGLSLYENLLDPKDSSATISSAPILYNQTEPTEAEVAKKAVDPALRFQPIRRPQINKPVKAKPTFPKAVPKPPPAATAAAQVAPAQQKGTLADWAATEDDEWLYNTAEKRQRGGRKKKKKKHVQAETDWNEIYDPTRPTNIEEYLRSDEKIDEVREWKALLYRHRRKREESDFSDDDEEEEARHVAPSTTPSSRSNEFVNTYFCRQINLLLLHRTLLYRPHLHLRSHQHLSQTIQTATKYSHVAWQWDKDKLLHHLRQTPQILRRYPEHLFDIPSLRNQSPKRKTTHTPHLQPSANPLQNQNPRLDPVVLVKQDSLTVS